MVRPGRTQGGIKLGGEEDDCVTKGDGGHEGKKPAKGRRPRARLRTRRAGGGGGVEDEMPSVWLD